MVMKVNDICMMPMKKNIKHAPKSWELVNCPRCGRNCYYRKDMDDLKRMGYRFLCTECALKIMCKTKKG